MARREERAYREYVSDEQRSQPGCPARELCDESLLQDTRGLGFRVLPVQLRKPFECDNCVVIRFHGIRIDA